METVYDLSVKQQDGTMKPLADYEGHPLLIVNTASKCGFSGQFKELQALYEDYHEQGLVVLGFPSDNFNNQEFDDIEETMNFCQLNHGVTFPMFAKTDVKGKMVNPLFEFLTSEQKGFLTEGIKWNFTKFLVNHKGHVVERFAPKTSPLKMKEKIESLLIEK